jgi:hypothetical protein
MLIYVSMHAYMVQHKPVYVLVAVEVLHACHACARQAWDPNFTTWYACARQAWDPNFTTWYRACTLVQLLLLAGCTVVVASKLYN